MPARRRICYRSALLFCRAIHFDRRDMEKAEGYYWRVLESVEQQSYDFFDALTHLGPDLLRAAEVRRM